MKTEENTKIKEWLMKASVRGKEYNKTGEPNSILYSRTVKQLQKINSEKVNVKRIAKNPKVLPELKKYTKEKWSEEDKLAFSDYEQYDYEDNVETLNMVRLVKRPMNDGDCWAVATSLATGLPYYMVRKIALNEGKGAALWSFLGIPYALGYQRLEDPKALGKTLKSMAKNTKSTNLEMLVMTSGHAVYIRRGVVFDVFQTGLARPEVVLVRYSEKTPNDQSAEDLEALKLRVEKERKKEREKNKKRADLYESKV